MSVSDSQRFIEIDFPLEEVSEESSREKSIRQGHISTLQQWWARRPLAVCRAAIFAALCPSPDIIESNPQMMAILDDCKMDGETTIEKLNAFTAKLSGWKVVSDHKFLEKARLLLMFNREEAPLVVDTFAGGGSIPIEALRLGLNSFAGELNPVAATALNLAIELLPNCNPNLIAEFKKISSEIAHKVSAITERIYLTGTNETPLAFLWCRTYICPDCGAEIPLMHDSWLEKGIRNKAVRLKFSELSKRFDFEIYTPASEEKKNASKGTIKRLGAECPNCKAHVSMKWLREQAISKKIGDRLYAKLVNDISGNRVYSAASLLDEKLAAKVRLSSVKTRKHTTVPNELFDKNGIRHTWAIQYGVNSTADLYNKRQGIALLELFNEIEQAKQNLIKTYGNSSESKALTLLLALTFNRVVVYNNRHAWWQSNGGFPANMFGRQAIPMVWNYVEIPINSQGAAGWISAAKWIEKVATHLTKLPRKGIVKLGDAANCELNNQSADLVAIDPPYYDSIAYSYLSDTFYVWMKELLSDILPQHFSSSLSPKIDEAIVDRPHSQAPSPKTGRHFRNKMLQSLQEIQRILKRDGRLIIMFGHKKIEAWDAMLGTLLEAGFVPTISLPIHTERKAKFRHGYIDALSSSCLIVCVPGNNKELVNVGWVEFKAKLKKHLVSSITRFQRMHLFGGDLTTSLIAPSCALFSSYNILLDDGSRLTIGELIKILPELTKECEYEAIINQPGIKKYNEVWEAIHSLVQSNRQASHSKDGKLTWRQFEGKHWLISLAIDHANLLNSGNQKDADLLWNKLSAADKDVFCNFLRAAALFSDETLYDQQLAQASLGRISMHTRSKIHNSKEVKGNIYQPSSL